MQHLRRALAVLLAACALPAATHADPSPTQFNLRLADLPPGFTLLVENWTAGPPASAHLPFVAGAVSLEMFSRGTFPHALSMSSDVDLYRTTADAHEAFHVGLGYLGDVPAISLAGLPSVGVQAAAYRYAGKWGNGHRTNDDTELRFWRTRYIVDITIASPPSSWTLPELVHLARLIDGRIKTQG